MKFLDRIKSIFRKKTESDMKVGTANADKTGSVDGDSKDDRVLGKYHSVTEASLVRTSYGVGKLKEDGNKRYLLFGEKMNIRYIPFVENECIEAVYTIDTENFIRDDKGRFLYEIVDSAQFFMLSKEQKQEIKRDLDSRNIPYRFPEEINNYDKVTSALRESKVLLKNQDSGWFEMNTFLSNIDEVKGSNNYKELQLIRLKDGRRFILIINQIIPNVIEYHPSFMNIYEPGAVKITYQEGYAFIAPFGKPKG